MRNLIAPDVEFRVTAYHGPPKQAQPDVFGQAMSTKTVKNAMALGAGGALIAGAVVIATASPSWAAPVLSNTAAVRQRHQTR